MVPAAFDPCPPGEEISLTQFPLDIHKHCRLHGVLGIQLRNISRTGFDGFEATYLISTRNPAPLCNHPPLILPPVLAPSLTALTSPPTSNTSLRISPQSGWLEHRQRGGVSDDRPLSWEKSPVVQADCGFGFQDLKVRILCGSILR